MQDYVTCPCQELQVCIADIIVCIMALLSSPSLMFFHLFFLFFFLLFTLSGLFGTFLSPDGEVNSLEEEEDEDDDDEEEDEEEEGNSGSGQLVLKNCFLAMVETLSKQVKCNTFM